MEPEYRMLFSLGHLKMFEILKVLISISKTTLWAVRTKIDMGDGLVSEGSMTPYTINHCGTVRAGSV